MRARSWQDWLSDVDILDVHFRKAGRAVTSFSVNHRADIGGRWYTCQRIDTAHGRLHRHQNWLPRAERVVYLETEPPTDRSAQLDDAVARLRDGWREARAYLEARLLSEEAARP